MISDEAEVVMKPAPALEFENVSSERAVGLFDALVAARASVLQPALSEAVSAVGVARLDAELGELVPDAALTKLASLGLRGELLFPTPSLLREKPTLIGYYRMLLGLSQKAFARLDGFKRFSAAEKSGVLSEFQKANLPALCSALVQPLSSLALALDRFDQRDLADLTLLQLGAALYGSNNNRIGAIAVRGVFDAIADGIQTAVVSRKRDQLEVKTPSGRMARIIMSTDPDISVSLEIAGGLAPRIAMEVKGGTDTANLHNRLGEAEKSHLKAMQFPQRWTLIHPGSVPADTLERESPSTTRFFNVRQVISREGEDWDALHSLLRAEIGLAEAPE